MTMQTSNEIIAEIGNLAKQIREGYGKIETLSQEMREQTWGSARFFELEAEIGAIQKTIPDLITQRDQAERALAGALVQEIKELYDLTAAAVKAITPKAEAILSELNKAVRKAEDALKAAAEPFNPSKAPLDIVINLNILSHPFDHAPLVNAVDCITRTLYSQIYAKDSELTSLKNKLGRSGIWDNLNR